MIRLEEYDLAQFSLTEGYVAVPFEVYQPVDGELIVIVYPGLEKTAGY